MTVSIDDFVDNVRADIPRCPDPAIENAVRDSIIEFCRKTWIVQRDFIFNSYEVDAVEELNDAPLLEFDGVAPTTPDVGMRPIVVLNVWVTESDADDYTPLKLMIDAEVAKKPFFYWENQTTDGLPTRYFAVSPDTIRVYPVPTINYYLAMKAAFKPKRDAVVFDDLLYQDWLDEIAAGAKFRLFSMPSKPWTDYTVAAMERTKFNIGVGKARIVSKNAFSNSRVSVTPGTFIS